MLTKDEFFIGIWTPTAHVLCLECHGPGFFRSEMPPEEFQEKIKPTKPPDWHKEGSTHCDTCGRLVVIGVGVAEQAQIRDMIRQAGFKADLYQSGGMCCNCQVMVGGTQYLTSEDNSAFHLQLWPYDDEAAEVPPNKPSYEGDIWGLLKWLKEQAPPEDYDPILYYKCGRCGDRGTAPASDVSRYGPRWCTDCDDAMVPITREEYYTPTDEDE